MRNSCTVVAAIALAAGALAAQAPATSPTPADTASVVVVDLTPQQGALEPLLKSEFAKAIAQHRTPFVELGATWCVPCQHLAHSLGDKRMIDAFAGTYIIHLDFDDWKGQLKPLGFTPDGIPAFFPIDTAGKATGPVITGEAWSEDTPANMAPALKAFFQANLRT